ncbi:MAG: (Fe-S)-binding protein [Brumimicrobium sp.]
MVSSIIFTVLLIGAFTLFGINAKRIYDNIKLGRSIDRTDNKKERLRTMLLVAFGQKKMFKKPLPAFLHFCIYAAFIITQIELIEIIVDGISGSHRIFRPALGGFYTFIISFIEFLSLFAFVATVAFLWRRNVIRIKRLSMPEMKGWPRIDGNLILVMELMLIGFIFTMNGADEALYAQGMSHAQDLGDGTFGFFFSQWLGTTVFAGIDVSTLHVLERIGWWGHIIMVFAFLNYLPYSKHLHIMLAFPNTYFSNLEPKGKFTNNPDVLKEVQMMMDPEADPFAVPAEGEEAQQPARFGAKDVEDLSWKQLLDSYSCTECGRCTEVCPANQTGKLLSPRKVMMDTRDRLMEKGAGVRKNGNEFDDGKNLHSYITKEELWACTSCNACVEACPVNIDPLSIITDMRRYLVMEESDAPTELTGMFSNIENNGAPWQYSQDDRMKWVDED